MKVIIVGYGRMGKEVESILQTRGHEIVARVDKQTGPGIVDQLNQELLKQAEGVIEFSLPQGVFDHVQQYAKAQIPVVLGTTGWENQKNDIQKLIETQKGTLIYGSNFSLGAHMFFQLVEKAAGFLKDLPEYDIMVTEWHHKLKKDSPSGTALTTGAHILKALPRKTEIVTQALDRAIQDQELHIASVRGGAIPGIHSVLVDSLADSIEIRHTARNRSGFALGSVLALEWLIKTKKTGFIHAETFMNDFFALN